MLRLARTLIVGLGFGLGFLRAPTSTSDFRHPWWASFVASTQASVPCYDDNCGDPNFLYEQKDCAILELKSLRG